MLFEVVPFAQQMSQTESEIKRWITDVHHFMIEQD